LKKKLMLPSSGKWAIAADASPRKRLTWSTARNANRALGRTFPNIKNIGPGECWEDTGATFNVGYISRAMADSVAENASSVTRSVHPIDVLQEALKTRIARHGEEVALVERQYHQVAKRVADAQARIAASESDREKLLQDLSSHTAAEVEKVLDAYHRAARVLALAEQRFDELADRRADAKPTVRSSSRTSRPTPLQRSRRSWTRTTGRRGSWPSPSSASTSSRTAGPMPRSA